MENCSVAHGKGYRCGHYRGHDRDGNLVDCHGSFYYRCGHSYYRDSS